jgi:hypothetical protein
VTVALAAACLLLGGWIVFFEARRATTERSLAEAQRVWPDFDGDQIARIDVSCAAGQTSLSRTATGSWEVTAPVVGRADSVAVDALLDAVTYADFDRTLDDERPEYGLDSPTATIAFSGGGGGTPLVLAFGAVDASGTEVYVRRAGDNRILVVERHLLDVIARGSDDFRDRALLAPPDAVIRVDLVTGQAATELARDSASARVYRVGPPENVALRADPDVVGSLLRRLDESRALSFASPPAGELAGARQLRFEAATGETSRVYIDVPAVVCGQGETGIVRSAEGAEQAPPQGPAVAACVATADVQGVFDLVPTLADRDLTDLDPSDIRDVVVTNAGATIHLSGDGVLWHADPTVPVDPDVMRSFVKQLAGFRAAGLVEPASCPAGSTPRVTLSDASGQTSALTLLGPAPSQLAPAGDSGPFWLVRRDQEPGCLLVYSEQAALLHADSLYFRPRQLLNLSRYQVAALDVVREDGPTERLEPVRGGESWVLTQPLAAPADAAAADATLSALADLRAERFVATETSAMKLGHPSETLTASLLPPAGAPTTVASPPSSAPASRISVVLGADVPGEGCYARLAGGGDSTPFVLDVAACTALHSLLLDRTLTMPLRESLQAVSIAEAQGPPVTLGRHGTDWVIERDGGTSTTPATDAQVDAALTALQSLNAGEVLGYGPPSAESGLASPSITLVLRSDDGGDQTILVGANCPNSANRYALLQGRDATYGVPSDAVSTLLDLGRAP